MRPLYLLVGALLAAVCIVLVADNKRPSMSPADQSAMVGQDLPRAEPQEELHVPSGVHHAVAPSGEIDQPDLGLASTAVYDAVGDPVDDTLPRVSPELEARYRSLQSNPRYPTLSARMDAIHARRPGTKYAAADILAAMEKKRAWHVSARPGAGLKLTHQERQDGRKFVDFDPLKVESLMTGDVMELALDHLDQTLAMRVDSIRIYDDGNIMWRGSIYGGEEPGSVSITQSEKVTVASVILAEEDFILEAHGRHGWIAEGGSLFGVHADHVDQIPFPASEGNEHNPLK